MQVFKASSLYIKQYLFLLGHGGLAKLARLFSLFIVSAFFDMIGIGFVSSFVALIGDFKRTLTIAPWIANIQQYFLWSNRELIVYTGLAIILIFICKAIAAFFIENKIAFFSFHQAALLRCRLLQIYLQIPYIFHIEKNSSEMINSVQTLVSSYASDTLLPSLRFASNTLITIGIISLLIYTHPLPVFGLVIFFLSVLFVYDFFLKKKIHKAGEQVTHSGEKIVRGINHITRGIKEIRVIGCEQSFYNEIKVAIDEYTQARGLSMATQLVPRYLIEVSLIVFMILFGIIAVGASISSTAVIFPVLALFAAAGIRLLPSITQIMVCFNQLRFSRYNMNAIYQDLNHINSIFTDNKFTTSAPTDSHKALPAFSEIHVNKIHYKYPKTDKWAIENVSFKIMKGQSIGLIGTSGAGKTTLVNVLLGLLTPQQGSITIDNTPISEDIRSWMDRIAYIPQDVFLADDTLASNIALGINKNEINKEKLMQSIELAQLKTVVEQLPAGVDTILGENAIRISGGQRQRVALARAFYHDRDIIIMDEATSALDNETEAEVVNAIKNLANIKTLIIIAHRLSTVQHCNTLIKLSEGKIVKVGSYNEVVNNIVNDICYQ